MKKKIRKGRPGGTPGTAGAPRRGRVVYPYEFRVRAVKEALATPESLVTVARAFGVLPKTLQEWVDRYRAQGSEGLHPRGRDTGKARRKTAEGPRRDAVVGLKREEPELGVRKIRDVLAEAETNLVSVSPR